MKGLATLAKRAFSWFSYALVGAAALITVTLIVAPRPDGGFPPSHPLTIATWNIMGLSVATVIFYLACCAVSSVVGFVVDVVRWIIGDDVEPSEAGA